MKLIGLHCVHSPSSAEELGALYVALLKDKYNSKNLMLMVDELLLCSGSQPSLYGTTHIPAPKVDDDAASSDSENGTLIEEGRYNEDGSFIGQYSTPDKIINLQNGRYYS